MRILGNGRIYNPKIKHVANFDRIYRSCVYNLENINRRCLSNFPVFFPLFDANCFSHSFQSSQNRCAIWLSRLMRLVLLTAQRPLTPAVSKERVWLSPAVCFFRYFMFAITTYLLMVIGASGMGYATVQAFVQARLVDRALNFCF